MLAEFQTYDFEGADGRIHAIRQCSLTHRFELRQRLMQLRELSGDVGDLTAPDAYDTHAYFRFLVDECLQISGIQPQWVNPDQMVALLFPHRDQDGKIAPSVLEDLNFPQPTQPQPVNTRPPATYAETLDLIDSYVNDLEKTIRLAKELPGTLLEDILVARSKRLKEQTKHPNGKRDPNPIRLTPDQIRDLKARRTRRQGGASG